MNRDIDVQIAEKVMGWEIYQPREDMLGVPSGKHPILIEKVPSYSTNIADAWQVVEKLKYLSPELEWSDKGDFWSCIFWKAKTNGRAESATTAPMAICLAALAAINKPTE